MYHLLPPQVIGFGVPLWMSLWSSGSTCFSCKDQGCREEATCLVQLFVQDSGCWLLAHSSTRHCQLPPLDGTESGGYACGGSFMRIQGSPSFCRPACVWWRDHGGAVPGSLPLSPMGGGRSSWQLGPAGWLQAEVMLVSWTDSLLQGQRANQVLRQMEPRPAHVYPKVPPSMRSVKRTTNPSVWFSHCLFFSHVSHLKMKNNLQLWVKHFLGCLSVIYNHWWVSCLFSFLCPTLFRTRSRSPDIIFI